MKISEPLFRFRPRPREPMETLVVRVPASLSRELDALASTYETLRSEVVRELLARGVARAREEMDPERRPGFEKALRSAESTEKPQPGRRGGRK